MPIKQPHPTLIIGLGGTGQWVACHVLKELMELYNLKKPDDLDPRVQILAIDTDFQNQAIVGVGQRDVSGGVAVSSLALPRTRQQSVGANVHAYVEGIARGQYPETASWFDARWFLEQPNHDVLLNLVHGAGQFRPLGRVAVPFNLVLGGGSLRNALTQAINKIKQQIPNTQQADSKNPSLTVCITGSLCGGTGAGMFVDVAHLVQSLAAPTTVGIRGYLVLPNAFEGTVPPEPDNGAAIRQRAFAAMRELRRFAREVNFESGYPMYYAGADQKDLILRGKLKKTLFELLYYFDASLIRSKKNDEGEDVPDGIASVPYGMAPLIAEAILLWVDGRTSTKLLSHTTNLTAAKVSKVAAGKLDPKAAVAGGMGVYSVQLPLMHFQDEWACDLGREVLKKFLGVPAEGGEDPTTKTVIILRDNWAGGASGKSGRQAAQSDWTRTTVGGTGLGSLEKDLFKTGVEARAGIEARAQRDRDLINRTRDGWEQMLAPAAGPTDADKVLSGLFLSPEEKVLEWKVIGPFRKKDRVDNARVPTTEQLGGDGRKEERGKPKVGAERIRKDVAEFLDRHLGEIDPLTRSRGGTDRDARGQYTEMLRGWAETHVVHFREALRAWVAEALNGTSDPARTPGEDAATAVKNRAGKLGYTLALLEELSKMLSESENLLRQQETHRLGLVISQRDAAKNSATAMEKDVAKQVTFLEEQQKILEAERTYAAMRAVRWAAGQMHSFTRSALDSLQGWKTTLTQTLYPAVWKGQEQVQSSLAEWEKLSAVRQIVNLPETKKDRYRHYAEKKTNAVGDILNNLRWRVDVKDIYDAEQSKYRPALAMNLQLEDMTLVADGVTAAYLQRCRQVFAEAWENETLLGWLSAYYNRSGGAAREVTTLAQELSKKGALALRCQAGANPYKFVYVRANWRNTQEEAWLNGLITNLVQAVGEADATHSQTVESSDPFRLTILTFHELIDVEKLTAYVEGKDTSGGASGYTSLRAQSDSTSLSRQVLHVFAAERNAAIYEERLGYLLPDRVVALLEDRDRFRLFVLAWAYGQVADGQEILLNTVRLPDSFGARGGKFVRRLTTGPFAQDVDPYTGERLLANQRWLGNPSDDSPSLVAAAETFLLRGCDAWQAEGKEQAIEEWRVRDQVAERREALAAKSTHSDKNKSLWDRVQQISDETQRKQREQDMNDCEHYQHLQQRLNQVVLPSAQQNTRDWQQAQGQDESTKATDAAQRAETTLDVDLLRVMREFIVDETRRIERAVQGQSQTQPSVSKPDKPEAPRVWW